MMDTLKQKSRQNTEASAKKKSGRKQSGLSGVAKNYIPLRNPDTGRLNINRDAIRTGSPRPAGPANKQAAKMQEMAKTPEGRDKLREMQRKSAAARSANARHKPKGYPLAVWKEMKKEASKRAERITASLCQPMVNPVEDGNIDIAMLSQQALQVAVEILLTPGDKSLRVSAAKLILEYTKQRPDRKCSLALDTDPEDFLKQLISNN
jgi:hypothetical protein